jgi:two-component system, NtrC family, nitrogen regulation sensor histidine kinase GlnL
MAAFRAVLASQASMPTRVESKPWQHTVGVLSGPDVDSLDVSVNRHELLDLLSFAVIVVNGLNQIEWLNATAQVLLEIGIKQAQSRTLSDVMSDASILVELAARARQSGEAISHRGLRLQGILEREAHERYVDVTASHLDHNRVLIEISDTTRQLRISRDATLLAQQDGQRQMARALAHEIKNPLGGLRGAAQLLQRELPDQRLHEYTELIVREADRLRKLVDNLLGPGGPQHLKPTNIHELLEHVYKLIRTEADEDVMVVRDYDPSLPDLIIDRDQIIQALLNIGRNAIQAVGSAGRIVIRTRVGVNETIGTQRHKLIAKIQFEDDGHGVPEHLAETLFYPLVTSRAEGSGLGLALAQDLVTRHGGLIEFDSRKGRTVFSVLLPVAETRHE